jgi:hypothetical protein
VNNRWHVELRGESSKQWLSELTAAGESCRGHVVWLVSEQSLYCPCMWKMKAECDDKQKRK